jgi:hypothetical protein
MKFIDAFLAISLVIGNTSMVEAMFQIGSINEFPVYFDQTELPTEEKAILFKHLLSLHERVIYVFSNMLEFLCGTGIYNENEIITCTDDFIQSMPPPGG